MDERTLQSGAMARGIARMRFEEWGARNLIKVKNPGPIEPQVRGYITFAMAVAGLTPAEIARMLGLRADDLADGAMVYRLTRIPRDNEFEVRGYTTLPDGKALPTGHSRDRAGYRVGQGALQYELTQFISAEYLGWLAPGQRFDVRTLRP